MYILQHNKRIQWVVFALFLIAVVRLPVEVGKGRDFLLGFSQVGILAVFAVVLYSINKWIGLFLVLAIVSSSVPQLTFESQRALKCVVFGLGWYYFVYKYGDTNLLMDTICVVAFTHFLATCVQFSGIPSIFAGSTCGLTYNPNEGAAMFALCFPAFLRKGRWKFLPMVIIGLLMIHSFGGILAVAIGTIFYTCIMYNGWFTLPVIVFLGLVCVFVDQPTVSTRWAVWWNAFKIYSHTWMFGFGLGHWETVSIKLAEAGVQLAPGIKDAWIRLHNTFLNGLVEMGIGFAVVLTGYLLSIVRRFTQKAIVPYTAGVVILVCCSTNSMFRMNAVNGLLAITWLAILQKEIKGETECQMM